ncbi:MAG TPA: 2OG-Fe(II) oxygenase, partial [Alphaproteobacteria bacterium]|nr:2OG-Fe(II) oxygenase [Alphaproteobacteria bacterium]
SPTLERKSILLLAGEGAENWAHQDNNDETPPLQAVLMLSKPAEDFTGGEFYVARQTARTTKRIDVVRYEVPFESPGDLVIFKAGKDSGWWHGMLPVQAGKNPNDGHLRKAIGMLQPAG